MKKDRKELEQMEKESQTLLNNLDDMSEKQVPMNEKTSVSQQTFNQILNYIIDKNNSATLPNNLSPVLKQKIQQTQNDFLNSEKMSSALSAPSTPQIKEYETEITSHQEKINQSKPLIEQKKEISKLQKQEDDLKAEMDSIPDTLENYNEKQELRKQKDKIINSKNELSREKTRLEGQNESSNNKIQHLFKHANKRIKRFIFTINTIAPRKSQKQNVRISNYFQLIIYIIKK